jgi:hypothetical protein
VPRALKASVVRHVPLAQRGKQMAAAIGHRERPARTDSNSQRTMRGLLHDGHLRVTEIIDSDEADGGGLGGAHPRMVSHTHAARGATIRALPGSS